MYPILVLFIGMSLFFYSLIISFKEAQIIHDRVMSKPLDDGAYHVGGKRQLLCSNDRDCSILTRGASTYKCDAELCVEQTSSDIVDYCGHLPGHVLASRTDPDLGIIIDCVNIRPEYVDSTTKTYHKSICEGGTYSGIDGECICKNEDYIRGVFLNYYSHIPRCIPKTMINIYQDFH